MKSSAMRSVISQTVVGLRSLAGNRHRSLPAGFASVRLASGLTAGAHPSLLVTAFGLHKKGSVAKISAIIAAGGGSIAKQKKIIVEDNFAMLTSVYVPDDAAMSATEISDALTSSATTEMLGFPVSVKEVDGNVVAEAVAAEQQRRLELTCRQRPGLVLSVTGLLKDHGCGMSGIDAETYESEGEIWFSIECLVDVPSNVDAKSVQADLRYWVDTERHATLIFEKVS